MSESFGKYDYSQVITINDLKSISRELHYQYYQTRWYQFRLKWGIGLSIGVLTGLISWIVEGKGEPRHTTKEGL